MKSQPETQQSEKEALLSRKKELEAEHKKRMEDFDLRWLTLNKDERERPPMQTEEYNQIIIRLVTIQKQEEEDTNWEDRYKLPAGWEAFNAMKKKDRIDCFQRFTHGLSIDCPHGLHYVYLYQYNDVAIECTFQGQYVDDLVALSYNLGELSHRVNLDQEKISRWIPIDFFPIRLLDYHPFYEIKNPGDGRQEDPELAQRIRNTIGGGQNRPNYSESLLEQIQRYKKPEPARVDGPDPSIILKAESFSNWKLYKRKFGFGGVIISE